jgi:hypothetical protein
MLAEYLCSNNQWVIHAHTDRQGRQFLSPPSCLRIPMDHDTTHVVPKRSSVHGHVPLDSCSSSISSIVRLRPLDTSKIEMAALGALLIPSDEMVQLGLLGFGKKTSKTSARVGGFLSKGMHAVSHAAHAAHHVIGRAVPSKTTRKAFWDKAKVHAGTVGHFFKNSVEATGRHVIHGAAYVGRGALHLGGEAAAATLHATTGALKYTAQGTLHAAEGAAKGAAKGALYVTKGVAKGTFHTAKGVVEHTAKGAYHAATAAVTAGAHAVGYTASNRNTLMGPSTQKTTWSPPHAMVAGAALGTVAYGAAAVAPRGGPSGRQVPLSKDEQQGLLNHTSELQGASDTGYHKMVQNEVATDSRHLPTFRSDGVATYPPPGLESGNTRTFRPEVRRPTTSSLQRSNPWKAQLDDTKDTSDNLRFDVATEPGQSRAVAAQEFVTAAQHQTPGYTPGDLQGADPDMHAALQAITNDHRVESEHDQDLRSETDASDSAVLEHATTTSCGEDEGIPEQTSTEAVLSHPDTRYAQDMHDHQAIDQPSGSRPVGPSRIQVIHSAVNAVPDNEDPNAPPYEPAIQGLTTVTQTDVHSSRNPPISVEPVTSTETPVKTDAFCTVVTPVGRGWIVVLYPLTNSLVPGAAHVGVLNVYACAVENTLTGATISGDPNGGKLTVDKVFTKETELLDFLHTKLDPAAFAALEYVLSDVVLVR